jgi:serine/threonine-protein kinase
VATSHLSVLVGRVLAGRYRLVAPLGTGASARVYLADDVQLQRRVAVKVLHEGMADDPGFLKRFGAEALAAAALNHPNIMHVYDSGTDAGLPYLVCEYLGGGSLQAMLAAGHRLSPSQALVVGLEVARGLDYAHHQGLVHRDIKPGNLLFGEDGRLRIADFGLARAIAEAAWTEPQGMLVGTVRYAAPEQARGRSVDGRADVYSLAVVLIEAVTGVAPFQADTATATLMARCETDLPVPEAMGRLRPVLERAGRLDPTDRADAGELELGFLAAAEDMDRPDPLPLVGALDPEAASAAADLTNLDLEALVESAAEPDRPTNGERPVVVPDDLTVVMPLAGGEDAAPSSASSSTGSIVDIPLDSDPAPLDPSKPSDVAAVPPAPPGGPTPARRRRWARPVGVLAAFVVLAAAAVGGWLVFHTPSAPVPKVVGLNYREARERLVGKGWTVTTELQRRDGTKVDEVIGQRPRTGTDLERGRRVTLQVSRGNTLVVLPPLVNVPEQQALDALGKAGLEVDPDIARPNDEQVPAGTVISARTRPRVDASDQLPKGSVVTLTVSAGPAPRSVPDGLVGQSYDAGVQALAAVQLKAEKVEAYSDQPVGQVLSAAPAAGEKVRRDSTVRLTVSKGPEPKPIPNVVGMTVFEASEALAARGFAVSGVQGSTLRSVRATDPPAGGAHPPGTAVQLITHR